MFIKTFSCFFYLFILAQAIRFKLDRIENRFNPEILNVTASVNEKKVLNLDWDMLVEVNRVYVRYCIVWLYTLNSTFNFHAFSDLF